MKIPFRPLVFSFFILTTLIYLPTLKAGFVYDDLWYLARNPAVRSLNVIAFFRDPRTAAAPESGLAGDVYRPLGTLAFALAFKGWKLNAWPSHLACLLLHLLNGVLFWKLLLRLLKNPSAALVGTCVFLFHPAQVQTVAWIAQIPSLLGAAGFLLALNTLAREGELSFFQSFLGWIAFAAAVLSKETTIILPLIAGLFWDRQSPSKRRYMIGLVAIAGAYLICRQATLHHLSQFSEGKVPTSESLKLGLLAFPVYLGKIIFPLLLRVSYGYPTFAAVWIPPAVGVLVIYLGAIWCLRNQATPSRAMGWILLGLLPVLQIIPIRAFVAERFLYIPLMGVGWLVGWIWKRFERAKLLVVVWVISLAIRSAMAVPVWYSERTLWAEAVRQEPANAFAHVCYAQSLGDDPEAEEEYFKTLVNQPADGIRFAALQNLASLHHQWGHTWKANYWRQEAGKVKASF